MLSQAAPAQTICLLTLTCSGLFAFKGEDSRNTQLMNT